MATGTKPFFAFEWMISLRYLGTRRKEGFISVIAGFSFLGILLGVATLIIAAHISNAGSNDVVTASAEQMPSTWRVIGFFRCSGLTRISLVSFSIARSAQLGRSVWVSRFERYGP